MTVTTASIKCEDSFYNKPNWLLLICMAGSLTTDDRSILQTLLPRNIPQPSWPTIIQNVRIRFQGGSPIKPNPNLLVPALFLFPYLLSRFYLLNTSHFHTTSLPWDSSYLHVNFHRLIEPHYYLIHLLRCLPLDPPLYRNTVWAESEMY